MKKIISVVVCVCMIAVMFATHAMATTTPSSDQTQYMPINGARLVAFGDSITEYGTAWQNIVATKTGATVVNCGKGGSNTGYAYNHALERFDRQVAPQYPDFVTILFGVNDAVKRDGVNSSVPLEDFKANIKTIISKVKAIGAIPILITQHHVVESAWYSRYNESDYAPGGINAYLDEYYNAERAIAAELNVHLIDFNIEMDKYAQSETITADGVHLTAKGNQVLGDCIADFMTANFPGVAPETSTRYTVTASTTAATGQTTTTASVDAGDGPKDFTVVYDFTTNPRGVNKTNVLSTNIINDSGVCAPGANDTNSLVIIPTKADGTATASTTYTFAIGAGDNPATTKPAVVMAGDGVKVWINYTCDAYETLNFDFALQTYGDSQNVTGAIWAAKNISVTHQGQWVMIPYSAFTNSSGSLDNSTNGTRAQRLAAINRVGVTVNVPTVDDITKVFGIYVDSLGYYTNIDETTSATTTAAAQNYTNPYTVTGGLISGIANRDLAAFIASFNCTNGAAVTVKKGDNEVTTGSIATGMTATITQDGNAVQQFAVVIYGDINGDGSSNASDLLLLKRSLLGLETLQGAYKSAANVTHKQSIDASASDLLKMKRALLQLDTIEQ